MDTKIIYCGPNLYSPELVSDFVNPPRRNDIPLTHEEQAIVDNLTQEILDCTERSVKDGY